MCGPTKAGEPAPLRLTAGVRPGDVCGYFFAVLVLFAVVVAAHDDRSTLRQGLCMWQASAWARAELLGVCRLSPVD